MAKLEVLIKDGGVEEFETTPVADTPATNPSIPRADNQTNALLTGGVLLNSGSQVINTGVSLVGELTGDYGLEKEIKANISAVGIGIGLITRPQIAIPALAITTIGNVVKTNAQRKKSAFTANQNAILTGLSRSDNSRLGGRK